MNKLFRVAGLAAVLFTCLFIAGCDDVRVYGSVGYSSYNGYNGLGTRVSVGGRIR